MYGQIHLHLSALSAYNQTDFKDLGYGYDIVELVTEGISQGIPVEELYSHSQITTPAKAQMKKYETMFGKGKFNTVTDMVNDVARRHYGSAKAKEQILHPPPAPVTLNYR